MATTESKLGIYYIDFSGSKPIFPKENTNIPAQVAKDLLIPLYFFKDGVKLVKGGLKLVPSNFLQAITSEEELAKYKNGLENEWIIHRQPEEVINQFYIRHPKKAHSNILIESKSFNKYVYDEFCQQLINYCCSHCPAKHIQILTTKAYGFSTNAKILKKVKAGVAFKADSSEIFRIDSDTELKKVAPLKNYSWLDQSLRQAIDTLVPGAEISKNIIQDFTFGTDLAVFKYVSADLNYACAMQFTINIKC